MPASGLIERLALAWAAPLLIALPLAAAAQPTAPPQPADASAKERELLQKINALKAPQIGRAHV